MRTPEILLTMARNNAKVMVTGGAVVAVLAGISLPGRLSLPLILTGTGAGATLLLASGKRVKKIDGREVVSADQLTQSTRAKIPRNSQPLKIANVPLKPEQEVRNILLLGRPGSGKSQAIAQLIEDARKRSDIRVVTIDRQGEVLKHFYNPKTDILFNPQDLRSVGWSHVQEMGSLDVDVIVQSLMPIRNQREPFWEMAGQQMLMAIWEQTLNNQEVDQALNSSSTWLAQFLSHTGSAKYFADPKMGADVLATLAAGVGRAYRYMSDHGTPFSFFDYGQSDDPRWLHIPMLARSQGLKPIVSMAVDLLIMGILSRNSSSGLKTFIIIDELGSLQKLPNLQRILSEGRKYGGNVILGMQAPAQISEIYSPEMMQILIQNTFTKLFLSSPDPTTSQMMADMIGRQRYYEQKIAKTRNYWSSEGSETHTWERQEEYVIQPHQLQSLPDLEGFLVLADNSPIAKVNIKPKSYPEITSIFLPHLK
jgi:hypothetical protein